MAGKLADEHGYVRRVMRRHHRRTALLSLLFVFSIFFVLAISYVGFMGVDVTRAYVAGEGQYSKEQKAAVIRLLRFTSTRDFAEYRQFQAHLRAPRGDLTARLALSAPAPDFSAAARGFIQGKNARQDTFLMSLAFVVFKNWQPFARAVGDWRQADHVVGQLSALGDQALAKMKSGKFSKEQRDVFAEQVASVDEMATKAESAFSKHIRVVGIRIRQDALWIILGVSAIFGAIVLAFILRISGDTARGELALEQRSQDLAKAKRAAEAANRQKSRFLANMSHELRTPLNAIIGFSEMIKDQVIGPINNERYLGYAGDIRGAGKHLLAIINDILDLSRIEAGKLELHCEQAPLNDLLDRVIALCGHSSEKAGVALSTEFGQEDVMIFGDELRLKQVILNLVSNSIKFTKRGGRICVGFTLGPGGEVVIRVADNGIGMTPEELAIAMAPFGQVDNVLSRSQEGTGLGLPLTKSLVEAHGAQFAVHSEAGFGTEVRITFPARLVSLAEGEPLRRSIPA